MTSYFGQALYYFLYVTYAYRRLVANHPPSGFPVTQDFPMGLLL